MFASKPTAARYRTPTHRATRAHWARVLATTGALVCMQPDCIMESRHIGPGDAWHLGHTEDGHGYIGPTHAECNVRDGAKRGNAKQRAPRRWQL